MKLSQQLQARNITLPPLSGPFGSYVPIKRVGNLIFVAGQLPMKDGRLMATGAVPSGCSIDDARAAAKQCVVNALSAVQSILGSVDVIKGVARVGAFVRSDDTFFDQPGIANAASDLLVELLGERGRHVRAAVGTNVLPRDAAVEIEFIFEAE
jgi:enamine deaminase RidA (YjgF/YER057c/UK114 family)